MLYTFTVNTDASFDVKTQTAAWACWIKSSHFRIKESALFTVPVPGSSMAELMAIEQALLLLDALIAEQPFLQDHDIKLFINTDSMFALHAITKKVNQSKHKAYMRHVRDMLGRYVETEVRHVKAHVRVRDARGAVNNWCDKACRAHLQRRVKEINGNV